MALTTQTKEMATSEAEVEEALVEMWEMYRTQSGRIRWEWVYETVCGSVDLLISAKAFDEFTYEVENGERCYFDGKKDEPLSHLSRQYDVKRGVTLYLSECESCAVDRAGE